MPKQYTFRTTKATEWMEPILDAIPQPDRSRFLRTCVELALEQNNSQNIQREVLKVARTYEIPKKENVSPSPTKQEIVTPVKKDFVTQGQSFENSPIPLNSNVDDLFGEGTEVSVNIDLDKALNSMYA